MDATIYRVSHSLTFEVLVGVYDRYIIEAVNEHLLRSSSMGWYDEDYGDSGDPLDHADKND